MIQQIKCTSYASKNMMIVTTVSISKFVDCIDKNSMEL
jgi:hypothetical protein